MADDRLTGLDASFLHLEDDNAHMHVAAVLLFDGDPPEQQDVAEELERRLHLVPRYRQKLAFVPFGQGRPLWVDDPHFNLDYHVRKTALPEPGSEEQLRNLAGRVFSQRLDRDKPLWELWIVEGLEGGRFAVLSKTHHALVDGVSGVDVASVLFDTQADPQAPPDPGRRWLAAPAPSPAHLLAKALAQRVSEPAELVRGVRAALRTPRRVALSAYESLVGVGAMAWAGMRPAPATIYNQPIGPHRRFDWVRVSLDDVKAIKDELRGTVNDVMLTVVTGALGRHLRRRGVHTDGLVLRTMVPVSVRAELDQGALGNRVAAMMAPLPVGEQDLQAVLATISEAMRGLKESGQAVGAQRITELSDFAPPTVMAQASRLMARQRFFNLVVTNVPGPQFPLYLMGREMLDVFPMVPLAGGQAVGVAIMSYNGKVNFGLVGDYDVMYDLDEVAVDVADALADLAGAAGVRMRGRERGSRRRFARAAAAAGARSRERETTAFPRLARQMRERVNARARELGLDVEVTTLDRPTRTVQEAASAVGCDAERIVKSVVFVCDGDPVLVVASGAHRIDQDKVADLLDCAEVRLATPDEVRVATGFAVGGVAPFGHDLPVILDRSLLDHDQVWAAGGDGSTLFCVHPRKLSACIQARVADVAAA